LEDQEILRELRSKISRAREACAGSHVQPIPRVVDFLTEAISYAMENGFGFVADILVRVKQVVERAKVYGDRLEPDQKLSDILNRLDSVIG